MSLKINVGLLAHCVKMATYLVVLVSVVADENRVPEGEDSEGAHDDPGVPKLMVMGNPASNESPEGLIPWISTQSSHLLRLATCFIKSNVRHF